MSVSMKSSAAALAAVIGAVALMPSAASAQSYGSGSYGYNNGYQNQGYSQGYSQPYNQGYSNNSYSNNGYQNQDRCRTLGQGRTGAGATIGAGIGAIAGSQIAARGRRTEGSIVGGLLGAVVGAQVGRASNSNCQPTGYSYGYQGSNGYQGSAYAPSSNYYNEQGRYDDRAQSSGRYDDRRYDNRSNDRRYDNGYEISADGYYYFDPRRGWLPR